MDGKRILREIELKKAGFEYLKEVSEQEISESDNNYSDPHIARKRGVRDTCKMAIEAIEKIEEVVTVEAERAKEEITP